MNIYAKIEDWLKLYKPLNNWIYFNATPDINGTVAMNSVAGDRVIKRFVDGSKQKEVLFAIDMISLYDNTGTSDINMKNLDEVDNFIEWLELQDKEKNYPTFNDYTIINKLEVLNSTPTILVNTQDMLSKYQFQVRISYKDIKEAM